MLDPAFVADSLNRALAIMQANITVAGQQEISADSERYLAVVADIVVPLTRFRCWYDSATLDLLRWETDAGIVAVQVDEEDIALSVPDQCALAAVMAHGVTVRTGFDPEEHRDAVGFNVQVDLWVVAMAPDLESAIESAGQEFEGTVTHEKGCWHIMGTFTTSRVSNGSWASTYETADGSPPLVSRDDMSMEYTRREEGIEADDPVTRAKAVEILGGEPMLSTCTRWEAVERICWWVSGNVRHEITQIRTARATLESMRGDSYSQNLLTVAMLRSIGVPCRLVSGMCLTRNAASQHVWVQVFMGEKIGWIDVDPAFREVKTLRPRRFMPWGTEGSLAPAVGPASVRVDVIK